MSGRTYPAAMPLKLICGRLSISTARVLDRAGLAADYLEHKDDGVDAETWCKLWSALAEESSLPDLPLLIGKSASSGVLQPAIMAFSASPDLQTGLRRLTKFKPLVAPVCLEFQETANDLSIRFHPAKPLDYLPLFLLTTEIVYFIDLFRTFTAHNIQPLEIVLPERQYVSQAYEAFMGVPTVTGPVTSLTISMADATRPLISADTSFYNVLEKELFSRLSNLDETNDVKKRVRRVILDLLPSGEVSVDLVCDRLGMSKRTLQRKLQAEDTNFQHTLDETRTELALTYLRDQHLSAEETSYLLAYHDPNSFYRAFHEWTGMTPAEARSASLN